jgi:MbtH protein
MVGDRKEGSRAPTQADAIILDPLRSLPFPRPVLVGLLGYGADMTNAEEHDLTRYAVVVNDEEQYSIWPAGRSIPAGWHKVGVEGVKSECLAYIAEVWTDLRPLSIRR